MSNEAETPGTFAWAKAHLDKQKEAEQIARAEHEARRAAEQQEEERKADPANLTHEEAIEEVRRLRERVSELEAEIEELEEWQRRIRRTISGDSGDW